MRVLGTEDLAVKLVPDIVVGGELRPPRHFTKGIHPSLALADDPGFHACLCCSGAEFKEPSLRQTDRKSNGNLGVREAPILTGSRTGN